MGRSQRTIDWYQQKMDWYRRSGGVENLEELNAFELKRFLAEQQERGLSDNTIHGFFQVIKSFANWCSREEYPVDPSVLRMRPPKVALKEMSTYTAEHVAARNMWRRSSTPPSSAGRSWRSRSCSAPGSG